MPLGFGVVSEVSKIMRLVFGVYGMHGVRTFKVLCEQGKTSTIQSTEAMDLSHVRDHLNYLFGAHTPHSFDCILSYHTRCPLSKSFGVS